jgi:Tfp pilus assembly protein PilW
MQKIDDCKEIRLALTRAGIATRPEKCLQTFRLVVTAQYIYHIPPTGESGSPDLYGRQRENASTKNPALQN